MDEKNILKQRIVFSVIVALIAGIIFMGSQIIILQKESNNAQLDINGRQFNDKVLNFMKLFVTKVLKADKEIDFDTRLQLENAIRDINDNNIKLQWDKFTSSKSEEDAQKEVKNLLEVLLYKIKT